MDCAVCVSASKRLVVHFSIDGKQGTRISTFDIPHSILMNKKIQVIVMQRIRPMVLGALAAPPRN